MCLFVSRGRNTENGGLLRGVSVPQRLLIVSALTYGGVFALLVAYNRPGLGIGQLFTVPVILAGAATSSGTGALAGAGALFLYELGIHADSGLTVADFTTPAALTRLAGYVAVGALTGFLALRGRRMLAQSLNVLEDTLELARAAVETTAADGPPQGDQP